MRKVAPTIKRKADARAVKPPAKTADPLYRSKEHLEWRELVVARAGRRCQHRDTKTGQRCTKAEPEHRMFADHIIEVRDGGPPFEPANGQCLCGAHHTTKTIKARVERLRQ